VLTKKLRSPHSINKEIARELDDIILKALEKNPGKRYDAPGFSQAINSYLKGETIRVEGSFKRRLNTMDRREFLKKGGLGAAALALTGGAIIGIKSRINYKNSLYSTLDKIREAETWVEEREYLNEFRQKLFEWVFERSKYLRKDAAPIHFNDNKTTSYINDSYHGFYFIRDIYSLGFREERNPEFLQLFTHFYDLTRFYENKTYQYYLHRFKIDSEMFELLESEKISLNKVGEFKNKMKAALRYLLFERYNHPGEFFQYINKNNEKEDKQVIYACTQYYTIPFLTEGFKVFNIKKEFGINPAEYLTYIINQTRTSNRLLVNRDYGVHFGAYFYTLSKKKPKIIFKSDHSNDAYLSEEMIKYIDSGLYPLINLFDRIEKIRNKKKVTKNNLEENVNELPSSYLNLVKNEKSNIRTVFIKILNSYRAHLKKNKISPYYIPIQGKDLNQVNPPSVLSSISYFKVLNSLLNKKNSICINLPEDEINEYHSERKHIAKSICEKENFNKLYKPAGHQSFFNNLICDITKPSIISEVETELNFLKGLSDLK